MTVKINMSLTRVLFTRLSPQWSLEASQFLLDFWANTLHLHVSKSADHFLTEALEYNQDVAASIQHHVDTLKSRMELQLDILYSFVAQKDNRLNTRIARSSGRDSVSMKILAFISAIFLPPSYIAVSFRISNAIFCLLMKRRLYLRSKEFSTGHHQEEEMAEQIYPFSVASSGYTGCKCLLSTVVVAS